MNTTKAYKNVIQMVLAIGLFITAMGMACDDGPVGEPIVTDVINAGANANGDGQVDTTPCNGIVC